MKLLDNFRTGYQWSNGRLNNAAFQCFASFYQYIAPFTCFFIMNLRSFGIKYQNILSSQTLCIKEVCYRVNTLGSSQNYTAASPQKRVGQLLTLDISLCTVMIPNLDAIIFLLELCTLTLYFLDNVSK